ncbi:hypothetical protein EDD21DRAFT_388380 [Dissophora ornata]|nr:hypothetical protein EDD21DRAFT_388380 [Dissophora ornata]
MAPANRAWIRSKMAAIKKTSGIAFSEEIFLSILICLIARHKHLVLHTSPDAVPELKSIVEQHSAFVFGLTTATIVCHGQQTRADIISAITGRHADMAAHATPSTPSSQYQFSGHHHHSYHQGHLTHPHPTPGHYYQFSNPTDEYAQRSAKLRFEKSRRSVATNHSEASDYSLRHHPPSIASFKTVSERDLDGGSIRRRNSQHEPSEYSRGGEDSHMGSRQSDSRSKGAGDAMTEHIQSRTRKAAAASPLSQPAADQSSIDNNNNNRRTQSSFVQTLSHLGGSSISHGQTPVTPVDFTFPRRKHDSVSNATGYGGVGGENSGITFSSRKIAQAIILDGLENASQEVFAVLLEMIINKEINDRNRYVVPDLIIIAIFSSPDVPDNIPKELLDYFAINGSYQSSIPQPRIQPLARKHALFRRTDWEELSKRMKTVTVSNDMRRYIRDVIVGIRTHEAIQGGLTSRAALDLEAIIKALAAIFQTTFVTPDLLTIAAEKVFSHRLELKSTRRRKMLAAATYANPSMSSSPVPHRSHSRGKLPMPGYRGTGPRSQRQDTQGGYSTRNRGKGRRDSSSSEPSTDGGASFVELSDSDEPGSSGASIVVDMDAEHGQGGQEDMDERADEKTAADAVRDVLRAVYPPV